MALSNVESEGKTENIDASERTAPRHQSSLPKTSIARLKHSVTPGDTQRTHQGKTSNALTGSSVPGYERPRGAQVGG